MLEVQLVIPPLFIYMILLLISILRIFKNNLYEQLMLNYQAEQEDKTRKARQGFCCYPKIKENDYSGVC